MERFSHTGFSFGLKERSIYEAIVEILDDALQSVTFKDACGK
jgi:hypothetical protein